MKKTLILVTAAAGKTGSEVAKQLLQQGYPMRAIVRGIDERSKKLQKLGAEVIVGDFFDIASIQQSLQGVSRAYFCFPPAERLLEATTIFAAAAKSSGLTSLVNMSQLPARENPLSPLTREHWLAERVLDWADLGVTHIRPSFFMEMPIMLNAQSIASEGKIYQPHGNGKHAPVASEDIARVAVGILTNPEPHAGKIYDVTGDRAMSQDEMAAVFSQVLGKTVQYVDTPPDDWQKAMEAGGLPSYVAKHLCHVGEDHRNGVFDKTSNVVEKIGGRKPKSLDMFIQENLAAFGVLDQAEVAVAT